MKLTFLLFTLVIHSAFSFDSFQITNVTKPDERDFFSLKTDDDQDYTLSLDCQSFFHGINYKENNSNINHFILLDTYSCGLIYFELTHSLSQNKNMCLHLDFKQKDWVLDPEISNCP